MYRKRVLGRTLSLDSGYADVDISADLYSHRDSYGDSRPVPYGCAADCDSHRDARPKPDRDALSYADAAPVPDRHAHFDARPNA